MAALSAALPSCCCRLPGRACSFMLLPAGWGLCRGARSGRRPGGDTELDAPFAACAAARAAARPRAAFSSCPWPLPPHLRDIAPLPAFFMGSLAPGAAVCAFIALRPAGSSEARAAPRRS